MKKTLFKNVDMKFIMLIFAFFTIISISLINIISAFDLICFHIKPLYKYEYNKYECAEALKTDIEDLMNVTNHMCDYLLDKNDNLGSITINVINEGEVPFFNNRELLHMKDVKELFLTGIKLRKLLIFSVPFLLIFYFLISYFYTRKNTKYDMINRLKYSLKNCCLFMFINIIFTNLAILLLSLLISSDFEKYFYKFHEIFFTNDLWLLNPATDKLIQLVPSGFFMDFSFYIVSIYLIINVLLFIIVFLIYKFIKISNIINFKDI